MRKYFSFLLLGIVSLVGLGGVVLGIMSGTGWSAFAHEVSATVQLQSTTSLGQAVTNTLKASNYSEYLVETTPQGNQNASLVYQAPDRLGGWLQSTGRRTYLVIIGTTEYISIPRPANSKSPLTFRSQQTTGAQAVDPAHTYLPYYNKGPATKSGSVTSVTLTQGGQTEHLTYTVTGNYISNFKAVTPGGTIILSISKVGSSGAVALPKGAKVLATPAQPQG